MGLTRSLDSRVYVALGRGLWDFTAKEIFDYVEGLQEGKENPARTPRPHKACLAGNVQALSHDTPEVCVMHRCMLA